MSDRSHEEDTFEFVDEPDSDYFCPVCQDLLTEPFQLECGHQLCRKCRDRLLSSNKTECPTCRDSDALSNAHFDKFLKRKVSSVRIHCQHSKEGCEWVGEVRDFQYHLDRNVVDCPFGCGKRSCQVVIKNHKSLCLNRPIGCDNCDYYNTFAIITEKHNPICLQSPVDCPNHCPVKGLKRSQLEQHFNECSHQLVNCPKTGCSVWLSRGEMELHKVHIEQHNLVIVESSQAAAITPAFRYLYNQPPIEFVIPNFQGMKDANAKWKSPLLFTDEKGYKFHLEVYPNGWGSGQDTHVSVYVSLIGDYDSDVALVFERDVVIELLNWRADKNHLLATVNFSRNSNHNGCASCSSSSSYENAPDTPGTPHFISYSSLCHPDTNTEYLQDDCLHLRVVDVAVYSTPLFSKFPSWQDPHTVTKSVCEFTLTDFTKRKQINNVYTVPFYTSLHGYKLCLKVYANGGGKVNANGSLTTKGTHIGIVVKLMRGDFDNDLQWPFEGDIIVEVLNWREDNHHYSGGTIGFIKHDLSGNKNSRVTKGEFSLLGRFKDSISRSSLLYNPDTNTEYLQDDCLRLRVVDVAIYSTPLLLKMPSWQDPHSATQSVCEFTLNEFTKRKQFNNGYYSPPFYTHPHGYKLCIDVYANGYGNDKGTYISIFAFLMRGDYDDNLQWPFEGDIVVELSNWREENHHYRNDSIHLQSRNDPKGRITSRVTEGEYAPTSLGIYQFISHSSLLYNPDTNTEYLQDDCLHLRVVDIAVYSTPLLLKTPSWQDPHTATQSVCEFTLTEFTKRKQFNNVCYIPSFYSHPNGYKLCLKVYANGSGNGKGTHISIFASLMRGDYDNTLQWPFEGDIVIELLNWRENSNHYCGDTICLNKNNDSDGSITSRVTEREYAPTMFGKTFFITHSSLLYNPDTNTEYLQDDCLRLRVVDVAVYSTPLLLKTPSWQDLHTATQSVCEFTLTEFTKRKQFNNVCYIPSFYSHPNGYKLCLRVYANGNGKGKGTHISIYANLMRGDYDNSLQWPFEGDIVIELLNWRENNNHYCGDAIGFKKYNDSDGSATSRVTEGEYAPTRLGNIFFITHSSLFYNPDANTEYLQDDCLRLRVVDVAVYSTPLLLKTPSWQDLHTATQSVCEFTLTEFTKRKQFNNVCYIPSFYSHPNGYKLCLRAYANGDDESKGTHISIYASLMKGDYDNNLQWPFEGDIIVELLNWRENNNHYCGDTFCFDKYYDSDGGVTSRVTEGQYALNLGKTFFITHSSLFYNPDTNTEYLQDDCLRLRVVDVAVYSTPLLLKTPSWQDPHTATQSVCEFTLTEFTKRKQFNNDYHSQSLYSHPNGYKLCLRVLANGYGKGKGTHISIYARLMKGDYDNSLQWPFEGEIVVKLLNWREDNCHYQGGLIKFSRRGGSATSRVTEGGYAPKSNGILCFISHSSLFYNPDTNTEYLQDDCLRLRVANIAMFNNLSV